MEEGTKKEEEKRSEKGNSIWPSLELTPEKVEKLKEEIRKNREKEKKLIEEISAIIGELEEPEKRKVLKQLEEELNEKQEKKIEKENPMEKKETTCPIEATDNVWSVTEDFLSAHFGENYKSLAEQKQAQIIEYIVDSVEKDPESFGLSLSPEESIDQLSVNGDHQIDFTPILNKNLKEMITEDNSNESSSENKKDNPKNSKQKENEASLQEEDVNIGLENLNGKIDVLKKTRFLKRASEKFSIDAVMCHDISYGLIEKEIDVEEFINWLENEQNVTFDGEKLPEKQELTENFKKAIDYIEKNKSRTATRKITEAVEKLILVIK